MALINESTLDSEGITPRAIRQLFQEISSLTKLGQKRYVVNCSFLQVYKERIYDMLNVSHMQLVINDKPGLKLKLANKDTFTVENLYTFECKTAEDVFNYYHFGIKGKVMASHNIKH